jgi:hypothetical protein
MYVRMYVCMFVLLCMYVCIYVCMYVCMCVCMYVCIYVCIMYVCLYICIYYVCMYVCMYVCLYICIYVCMYLLCMYVRLYVCLYVSMFVYMYLCMYVSIMYVCTFVCMYADQHVLRGIKNKGTAHTTTDHESPESEYRYNCTLSLTSALDGVGGKLHASAALPPGRTRYPLYRRLNGPQGRYGLVRKMSPTRIRSADRPVGSESLYRLSYPNTRDAYKILVGNPEAKTQLRDLILDGMILSTVQMS